MAQSFKIPNFFGGINEAVDESLLQVNETPKAQNCSISNGALSSCLGAALYTPAVLVAPAESIMTYYKDNVGIIIVAAGGKLYRLDNGVYSEIASGFTSNKFDFVNYNYNSKDVLVFTNGVDNVKVYDGASVRDLKNRRKVYNKDGTIKEYIDGNGAVKATEAEVTTLAPKGHSIELHYERLWIIDKQSAYFSTADKWGFDIEDWTSPTDEIEVNQHGGEVKMYTNDGGYLIGLKVIFDDLVLFKTKNVFKIFGFYPGNYQKVQIYSANGGIADKSVVTTSKGNFFCDKKGIFNYDGAGVSPVSKKLDETFKTLNKSYLQYAAGAFYNNKYILAVPEGASTLNNLIIELDVESGNFMLKRGITVSSFAEFDDKLLYVNESGKVFEYNTGLNWNGSSIDVFYETGYTDLDAPDAVKEIESIYFTGRGDGSIRVSIVTEKDTKYKDIVLNNADKVYNISLSNSGRLLKLKFQNINGSSFSIKGVKLLFELDED